MPLADHARLPRHQRRRWEGFHNTWATLLAGRLNHGWLPPGFVATPVVSIGGRLEVDVATEQLPSNPANGAGAPSWVAPAPSAVGIVDFAHLDTFEIQVLSEAEYRLVSAIELISPGNKDRPSHRRAFVSKCASYLQEGIGVLIVDIISERAANLHGALMELFPDLVVAHTEAGALYAAAYQMSGSADQSQLRVWVDLLSVGTPLPTMPLWIGDELSVPIDLEATYTATRELLLMNE